MQTVTPVEGGEEGCPSRRDAKFHVATYGYVGLIISSHPSQPLQYMASNDTLKFGICISI